MSGFRDHELPFKLMAAPLMFTCPPEFSTISVDVQSTDWPPFTIELVWPPPPGTYALPFIEDTVNEEITPTAVSPTAL
jgi:hypothetical protein